ncbi:hypothetical protein JTE90_026164 [Oedothorax gibbosus]|uniref:Serine/threonine-protein phosphatase PGAM5, mitochondrial n=1 Tax=Oedothorax gibbosus TaxID=931172 RepID=A0AAV6UF41_9ARAC|nr:hypothetical protein JTE90_026164 [Oedothorax gibbosus]
MGRKWKKRHLQAADSQQSGKWDRNWDKREPYNLVKPCKDENDPVEQNKFNEEVVKAIPTATRYIFLIRHGQYADREKEDKNRKLTELGNQQAELVGQRLKDLKFPYTKLIRSTLTRAIETTDIIRKHLSPTIRLEKSDLLCEGCPCPVEPKCGSFTPEYKYYVDGPRIEGAFRKYFHRAKPGQEKDSYEIIVCHANVIRYFVCRLLQFPPERWLNFSLRHCSITRVAIFPNGFVRVDGVGDCGFLPKEKMTTC